MLQEQARKQEKAALTAHHRELAEASYKLQQLGAPPSGGLFGLGASPFGGVGGFGGGGRAVHVRAQQPHPYHNRELKRQFVQYHLDLSRQVRTLQLPAAAQSRPQSRSTFHVNANAFRPPPPHR